MIHEVMPSIVHPVETVSQIGRAMTPPRGELLARVRPRTPSQRMEMAEKVKKEILNPKKVEFMLRSCLFGTRAACC